MQRIPSLNLNSLVSLLMKLKVDYVSLLVGVGIVTLLENFPFVSKLNWWWNIEAFVSFAKTSDIRVLKNKSVVKVIGRFPDRRDALDKLCTSILLFQPMVCTTVKRDICAIIRSIYARRASLFIHAMDNIVVLKNGMELLIHKIEQSSQVESFERSIVIDLDSKIPITLTSLILGNVPIVAGLLAFVVASKVEVRQGFSKILF